MRKNLNQPSSKQTNNFVSDGAANSRQKNIWSADARAHIINSLDIHYCADISSHCAFMHRRARIRRTSTHSTVVHRFKRPLNGIFVLFIHSMGMGTKTRSSQTKKECDVCHSYEFSKLHNLETQTLWRYLFPTSLVPRIVVIVLAVAFAAHQAQYKWAANTIKAQRFRAMPQLP